jgi:GntR family transcriptional regulator/MocR family aminotransferase
LPADERRAELLALAEEHQCAIVEDDYDSEFRYVSRPLEALKALDEQRRVLYVGTCSKVMFPALRIGYLVAAPAVVWRAAATLGAAHFGGTCCPGRARGAAASGALSATCAACGVLR